MPETPPVDATNWRAEQASPPSPISRRQSDRTHRTHADDHYSLKSRIEPGHRRGWTSVRRTHHRSDVVHPAAAMIVPANVGDVSPLIATAMSVIKQTRGPQDVG